VDGHLALRLALPGVGDGQVGVGFDANDQVLDLDVGVAVKSLESLWQALLL